MDSFPLCEVVLDSIAYPVAGIVQRFELDAELFEIPLREETIKARAEQPVTLDGPHYVYPSRLRKLHDAGEARSLGGSPGVSRLPLLVC